MSKINDGGPAYPITYQELDAHGNPRTGAIVLPGKTLRQWYAGQALAGLCVNMVSVKQDVEAAFKYADAMLAHEAAEREAK